MRPMRNLLRLAVITAALLLLAPPRSTVHAFDSRDPDCGEWLPDQAACPGGCTDQNYDTYQKVGIGLDLAMYDTEYCGGPSSVGATCNPFTAITYIDYFNQEYCCGNEGDDCNTDSDCCPPYICYTGEGNHMCWLCFGSGYGCMTNSDCCPGLHCNEYDVCEWD